MTQRVLEHTIRRYDGTETTYKEVWIKTDVYCPHCGKRKVWAEDNPGDYYEGPAHICTACGYTISIPRCQEINATDFHYGQFLEQLRKKR